MIKECKKHGMTEHTKRKDTNGYRCKECSKEYNKTRTPKISEKRKNKTSELIKYKGGKCQNCGYDTCNEALEFHHLIPKDKSFEISKNSYLSLEKLKEEVDKCILLCGNCHREVHDNTLTIIKEKDKITFEYK